MTAPSSRDVAALRDRRLAAAADIAQQQRVREQIAALEALLANSKPRRVPPHPATGCPCHACVGRDSRLEAIAEQRQADRQWASDRDGDIAADRYFGGAS